MFVVKVGNTTPACKSTSSVIVTLPILNQRHAWSPQYWNRSAGGPTLTITGEVTHRGAGEKGATGLSRSAVNCAPGRRQCVTSCVPNVAWIATRNALGSPKKLKRAN